MEGAPTVKSTGKEHVGAPSTVLWDLLDRDRGVKHHGASVIDLVAPLAGLLVLRWAAFIEAEAEAVAAFNDTPFSPLLPESLRQHSWSDLHGLPSRLSMSLPEISLRQDAARGTYVGAVAPSVLHCAERSPA